MEEKNLVQKQKVWGNYGLALGKAENDLAVKKMVIEKAIAITVTKENIKDAESILKVAKQDLKSLVEERKKITDPIDNVKSRLMEHEKSIGESLKSFETEIIGTKKKIQDELALINAKSDEKKLFLSKLNQAYIDCNFEYQRIKNEKVNQIYLDILEKEIAFDEFDLTVKARVLELKSNANLPSFKSFFQKQNFVAQHHDVKELNEISTENKQSTLDVFLELENDLLAKKVGYRSELANKEEAKKLALKEQLELEKQMLAEKQSKELEAKIQQANIEDATLKSDVKDLKRTFEVEMPNTPQTALQLFATFSANYDAVLAKLKVNQWMAFTPQQIANVLGRLKTENNSLEFSGITFKKVDKL